MGNITFYSFILSALIIALVILFFWLRPSQPESSEPFPTIPELLFVLLIQKAGDRALPGLKIEASKIVDRLLLSTESSKPATHQTTQIFEQNKPKKDRRPLINTKEKTQFPERALMVDQKQLQAQDLLKHRL